jgi:hypothetical protein
MLISNDLIADRQAESRAFTHFLRGEKGIEQLILQFIGNATAIIADADDRHGIDHFCPNRNAAWFGFGVFF